MNVPQADAESVKVGQRANISIAELPGRKFPGVVARTSNALDPTTRTLLTEVQVPNPDGMLMPGMFAQVDLTMPRKYPPLLIPGDTLVVRSDGPQVAVVQPDGTVHFTRIQLGRDFGDRLEVLSGLEEGQRLAVNPSDEVREGVKVNADGRAGEGRARSSRTSKCIPTPHAPHWRCYWPSGLAFAQTGIAAFRSARGALSRTRTRVHDLIRAGNLYLSLQDALALAIENNLDIELQRYMLPMGDTELLRAKGGGVTRGLNYTLLEVPVGPGGPLSPVPTRRRRRGTRVRRKFGEHQCAGAERAGRAAGEFVAAGHDRAIDRHGDSELRPGGHRRC